MMKRTILTGLLAGLGLWAITQMALAQVDDSRPARGNDQVFSITLGSETTVLTLAQRQALGFQFGPPDGYLGVHELSGTYSFFVPAQSGANCSTPDTQGTYRLGGDLSQFTSAYGCAAVLESGGAPNGYTFDRDYAGGGPVRAPSHGGQQGLLMVYHGEWHPGGTCNNVPWFYGSLGMAFSTDDGASFSSLGEIVQPYPTRTEGLGSPSDCHNVHVGYGTLVIADERGNPIPDPDGFDPNRVYYYVFYNDTDPAAPAPCDDGAYCIAVARAKRSEIVAAAFSGDTAAFPALFKKYYNGSFSQHATGQDPNNGVNSGHYTPMFAQAANEPTVLYDRAINQFLMAYQIGYQLYIQASPNLLNWSGTPLPNGFISDLPNEIGYITLVGEGSHPAMGGLDPYLFYLSAYPPFPDWRSASSIYVSRRIHIQK